MAIISGLNNKAGRIIIIDESDWSIEANQVLAASPDDVYTITNLGAGKKLVTFRKSDGDVLAFGNVTAGDDPASGSKDDSSYDHTFTPVGETDPPCNENSKFGSATLKFTGNDQKYTSPASSDWNLGTTFTISAWVRFDPYQVSAIGTNGGAKIVSNYQAVTVGESTNYDGYELGLSSTGYLEGFYYRGSYQFTTGPSSTLIANGGWHHVALQRFTSGESNYLRIYVDGVSESSSSNIGTTTHNSVTVNPFTIGARAHSSMSMPFLNGTIDELEIINGANKFATAGFTPPTTESTSTANHLLLMHFNDSDPEATLWYDTESEQHWTPANCFYNSGSWLRSGADFILSSQYYWFSTFRPEKIRITGNATGSNTFYLENAAHDHNIVSGTSATATITMNTTFESENVLDDFKHFNFVGFSSISSIQCDAHPRDPEAS